VLQEQKRWNGKHEITSNLTRTPSVQTSDQCDAMEEISELYLEATCPEWQGTNTLLQPDVDPTQSYVEHSVGLLNIVKKINYNEPNELIRAVVRQKFMRKNPGLNQEWFDITKEWQQTFSPAEYKALNTSICSLLLQVGQYTSELTSSVSKCSPLNHTPRG
jgi:hypothetical protein